MLTAQQARTTPPLPVKNVAAILGLGLLPSEPDRGSLIDAPIGPARYVEIPLVFRAASTPPGASTHAVVHPTPSTRVGSYRTPERRTNLCAKRNLLLFQPLYPQARTTIIFCMTPSRRLKSPRSSLLIPRIRAWPGLLFEPPQCRPIRKFLIVRGCACPDNSTPS